MIYFFLSLLFFLSFSRGEAHEKPLKVLVSIKPLHSLVSGVMKGRGSPEVLMFGTESPHTYALRPKDLHRIQVADIIFWVGAGLEDFLVKPLKAINPKNIALIGTPELSLLPKRFGSEYLEERSSHHLHAHSLSLYDAHVWLDPLNAQRLVKVIAERLSERDPSSRSIYQNNAARLIKRLQKLREELSEELKNVSHIAFLVFHDGYAYFEKAFHLKNKGVLVVHPEISPSLKKLRIFKERIKQENIKCIFSEPQFPSSLVDTLKKATQIQAGILDPLGIDLPPGEEAYFIIMKRLAHNFKKCLSS